MDLENKLRRNEWWAWEKTRQVFVWTPEIGRGINMDQVQYLGSNNKPLKWVGSSPLYRFWAKDLVILEAIWVWQPSWLLMLHMLSQSLLENNRKIDKSHRPLGHSETHLQFSKAEEQANYLTFRANQAITLRSSRDTQGSHRQYFPLYHIKPRCFLESC